MFDVCKRSGGQQRKDFATVTYLTVITSYHNVIKDHLNIQQTPCFFLKLLYVKGELLLLEKKHSLNGFEVPFLKQSFVSRFCEILIL